MTVYCIVADVEKKGVHGGQSFSSATTPTSTQVTEAIASVTLDVESKFYAAGIQIPITVSQSPEAYARIKDLIALGAAAEVEKISFDEHLPEPQKGQPSALEKTFNKKLKLYTDYPIYLIDAVLTSGHVLKQEREEDILSSGTMDKFNTDYIDDLADKSIDYKVRLDTEF